MDTNLLRITSKLKVLYVEDDDNLREHHVELLSEIFGLVDSAVDGVEGIERFKQFYKDTNSFYDIVITDTQMPKLDGIEMSKKILELNEKQHLLVLSAYNNSEYLEQFINIGVDGFIHKPVNYDNLLKKIEKTSLVIVAQKHQREYVNKINKLNQELESKVAQRTKELEKVAYTDTLTGYGNRYKLNQDILNSINPALAIINIDYFSQINDFYGHLQGDAVICKLGEIIFKNINSECELYHLQGDEFVVFNKNTLREEFIQRVTLLTDTINTTVIDLNGEELYIHVSTAISFENEKRIFITASMARKVGKKEDKSFIVYDDSISLEKEYKNNFSLLKKIKKGIGEDKFIPVFQPIVNNHNSTFEKYESLVRLKDGDKLLTPSRFLAISKQAKQYTTITKVMLRKIFETFFKSDKEFSINLTIEDIFDKDVTSYIIELLKDYQIGHRCVFEIVESEYISNLSKVQNFIEKVRSFGCKIAIDDFGTGYSNFEYIIKLNPDYIKIDGSLIKDIDENLEAEQVVTAIVDIAKKMDAQTIAEYVENRSIFDKVKALGIDYSQGYYFGAPIEGKYL